MPEVTFHSKDEAMAYAEQHGIAVGYTREAVYPDNHPTQAGQKYTVTEDNVEHRGVGWVILDDNRQAKPKLTPAQKRAKAEKKAAKQAAKDRAAAELGNPNRTEVTGTSPDDSTVSNADSNLGDSNE